MKKKFFTYFMIVIITGLTLTGFFSLELAQYFYKYQVEETLKNDIKLIEYQISKDIPENHNIDWDKTAKNYAEVLNKASNEPTPNKLTNTRITIINFQGIVLGESEANFKDMGNHSNRKEISEAMKGETGKAIRFSETLGVDFLYMAVPIQSSKTILRIAVPLTKIDSINNAILYYTLIGIFTGFMITILLALRFSSSLTKPVSELILASKEIAAGNYAKRVNIGTKDELGQLAATFNHMAAKLDETLIEMMDKNIKVETIINSMISGIVAIDTKYRILLINTVACEFFGIKYGPGIIGINILELIRNHQINTYLRNTLEHNDSFINEITLSPPHDKVLSVYTTPIKSQDNLAANAGAILSIHDITNVKKLEQIRTDFVSNVTHELKTPLTSIRGFIETLRGGAINDKDVAEKFLEIIDIEAERLSMLINDILQLSEIENKQQDAHIDSYQLKSIIDETLSIFWDVAAKKHINITHEVDENIAVLVNKDRLKQMLINLIDNGIKYNTENGGVHIKAFKSEGTVTIIVKDTGIGIHEEHISRIFERFYRVDKGRSRNMGGTGLGLSIVKHVVNLYSGDIKVNSEPGKGSEFVIQLPL